MIRSIIAAAHECAEPPLWVIRDAGSIIYLFGTSHLLHPDVKWRSPAIDRAFAESEELWTEMVDPTDEELAELIGRYGMDPAGSLSAKLDESDRVRLNAAAAAADLEPETVEAMRPWLAMMMLGGNAVAGAGGTAEAGPETELETEAAMAGKLLRGFETPESQIQLMADLSEATQLAVLKSTLRGLDRTAEDNADMDRAWCRGDVTELERLIIEDMSGEPAEFVDRMFTRRNAAWAEALAGRLRGRGISFVVVGVAHLVGPDSVQRMLEKKGVRAERVDPAG